MARSTGPVVVAGTLTWANMFLLDESMRDDLFTESLRMILVTGVAAGFLYGVEQVSEDIGVALAWVTLVTVLFVRVKEDKPNVLERSLDLLGVAKGRPRKT